jgi:hypothetical protein
MGNKKNKRGSIIMSSSLMTTKTELIERTPENDYGVLSDPEEGIELNQKQPAVTADIEGRQKQSHPGTENYVLTAATAAAAAPQSDEKNETHSPLKKQPSPSSSPSLSPQLSQQAQLPPPPSPSPSPLLSSSSSSIVTLSGQLTSSLPPPSPGTKSLRALQFKLTSDKNFSKKITLHTFFSYIILAIEIERASSASISRISVENVEKLVEYMIDNHTANKDIETYLNTLLKTDVIRNLIAAVIVFNIDQADALDKLLSTEQMEMELIALKDSAAPAAAAAPDAATASAHDNQSSSSSSTHPTPQLSQTSPFQSRTKRFLNFLKCVFCCGGQAPQRR